MLPVALQYRPRLLSGKAEGYPQAKFNFLVRGKARVCVRG